MMENVWKMRRVEHPKVIVIGGLEKIFLENFLLLFFFLDIIKNVFVVVGNTHYFFSASVLLQTQMSHVPIKEKPAK